MAGFEQSGGILVAFENQKVPDNMWERMIASGPDALSFGFVAPGEDGKLAIIMHGTKGQSTVENLNIMRDKFKDKKIVFAFYKGDMPNDDNLLQPYVVLDDETEKPLMITFAVGDFESYRMEGQDFPDAYMAVANQMAPQLAKVYKAAGNSLEKTTEELADNMYIKGFQNMASLSGDVVTLDLTGDVQLYSKNSKEQTYDWGWVSNPFGYSEGEKPKEETKKEETVTPKTSNKDVAASLLGGTKPAAEELKPKGPDDTYVIVKMRPEKNMNDAEKQKWYRERDPLGKGNLPPKWKDRPEIDVRMSKSEALKLRLVPVESNAEAKTPVSFEPIVPPDKIKNFLDDKVGFLKSPAMVDNKEPTSESIQDVEKKYPAYADMAGLTGIKDTFGYSPEALRELVMNYPEMAWILLLNYRAALEPYVRAREKAEATKETAGTEEKSEATGTTGRKRLMPTG